MEITWYGHACFRLKDRTTSVVTDPYDKTLGLPLPRPKADIVTISHDVPHHNHTDGLKGEFKVIAGPGEYEIGGIFITGIHLASPKKSADKVAQNNIYVIYIEDIAVCHLGDLSHVPTQNQVEDLGSIEVLMVPVGGQNTLNAAQAAEVISLIEPYIVIPMHYYLPDLTVKLDPVDKFLKEMGVTKSDTVDTLKLTKAGLPEETQIVLLEAKS
ncbi:MAG: MBL fold metallo-hydrolase [Anaerolineae bacterium]|nr:MBL fold metallo-hydrolase [Anaerolineae bacterium]